MAIIQARQTSTRLPNKILKKIGDKTMLEMVVNAVRNATLVDRIVVAAPHVVPTYGCDLFIGSEEDVLDRYYKCALKYSADIIVRITSDCPLLNTTVIDWAIQAREDWDMPFVVFAPIDGWDVEVFTMDMLFETWVSAVSKEDKEHVTPYMRRVTKLSVDTSEDYERMLKTWNGKVKQSS